MTPGAWCAAAVPRAEGLCAAYGRPSSIRPARERNLCRSLCTAHFPTPGLRGLTRACLKLRADAQALGVVGAGVRRCDGDPSRRLRLAGVPRAVAAQAPVADGGGEAGLRMARRPGDAAGAARAPLLSQRIRDYATAELKLPDNRSYRAYADLKRSAAVWNVVAAPELSLALKTWCFPVMGCVGYRGYFDRADADAPRRRAGARRLGGRRLRRAGVLDARLEQLDRRRPAAQHVHRLVRGRAGAPDLSRACPPGRLRRRRHDVQRVVRDRGRADRRRALAGVPRERRGARRGRGVGRAPQRFPRARRPHARAAAGDLRERRQRRREAARAKAEAMAAMRRARGAEGQGCGRASPATTAGSAAPTTPRSASRPHTTSWCRRVLQSACTRATEATSSRFYADVRRLAALPKDERRAKLAVN